jgi:hypothetical protein
MQEHSSAKQKELFRVGPAEKAIEKAKLSIGKAKHVIEHAKQLIIDMPIWRSSMYGMLHQADQLKDVSICIPTIVCD